jgi:hypothetical protein
MELVPLLGEVSQTLHQKLLRLMILSSHVLLFELLSEDQKIRVLFLYHPDTFVLSDYPPDLVSLDIPPQDRTYLTDSLGSRHLLFLLSDNLNSFFNHLRGL